MVTNGERLFVIEVPIDFFRSPEQIEQVEKLLKNMITIKNLNLPYELELLANDIAYLLLLVESQSLISSPSLCEEEYKNIINAVED